MTHTSYLFELSGEHSTLPEAEVISCLASECEAFDIREKGPGYVVAELPERHLLDVGNRLALSHRIGRYLGSCSLEGLPRFAESLSLPEGAVSVRAKQYRRGYPGVDSSKVAGKVGGILARKTRIDLESPEVELRILMSDALKFFICDCRIDRRQFDDRKVAQRPYFSPISLHPRFARALVNLSRVRRGDRLLDPFCGTGGITIEAALVGAKVLGSDISEEMIAGCMENMTHFGAKWEEIRRIDVGSISDVFGKVDAVVTDPPYGRSATTNKEPAQQLHQRALSSMTDALREGGNMAVVFPQVCLEGGKVLRLRETHIQRVHRSLTRHYCIFTKIPER